MKKILVSFLLLSFCTPAFAQNYGGEDQTVSGYTRANGTYVQSYHRSKANDNVLYNYSTKGNFNPYTGQEGKKYGTDFTQMRQDYAHYQRRNTRI